MRPVPTWKWATLALVVLAVAAAGVPSIRPAGAQGGGTLVVGLDQEPPTLDPHASPSAVTYQIIASVTENLLYRGPDGKLVPWLAESWTVARDGRSVTFKLRRDVKFHDGTPFNADAVKFNFDRIVDPKFKAGGSRAALGSYTGSKVLDEFTLQVLFETPYSPFLNSVASGVLSLVSPKAVRESGDFVHTRPVGTGPFMMKDYVAKDHATMVRFPGYARKAPWSDRTGPARLETVVWKFIPEPGTRVTTLESGETQGIYLVPAQSLPRLEKEARRLQEQEPRGLLRACPGQRHPLADGPRLPRGEQELEHRRQHRDPEHDDHRRRDQQTEPGHRQQALAIDLDLFAGSDHDGKTRQHDQRCDAVERPEPAGGKGDGDRGARRHQREEINKEPRETIDRIAVDDRRAFARFARPAAGKGDEQRQAEMRRH